MKATGPVVSQTQHPFGDPSATQFSQRDLLMRELQMRETRERMELPPLGAVSGTIEVSRHATGARHGWTIFSVVLLAAVLGACFGYALVS
jgi:hypothetical protein